MIARSLAGVATGALLIGGTALAAGRTEPSPPVVRPTATTTASPLVTAQSDTSRYPGWVVTTTSIRVRGSMQYGAARQARVSVSAGRTAATPRGTVTVTVARSSRTARLQDGVATVPVPRSLEPGRHTARARYTPADAPQLKTGSGSDTFTVVMANSRTLVQAFNTSLSERLTVRVSVESTTGVTPRGRVSITITDGNGGQIRSVGLVNGQAVVGFSKVDRRGQWDARAVYGGSDLVHGSRGADTFRVTR